MKKYIAYIGSIVCLLSVFLFPACSLFDSETSNGNTIGKIGDTITNADNVSICLVSCENTKELGFGLLADTTENNFILLTFKVTNNSNKEQTFSGSCVDLYNSNNVKYEYKTSLYINYIISEDIGAGVTKSFQVVFETPTTTLEEVYTAKVGYSTYTANSNRVTFILKENNSNEVNDKNETDGTNDEESSVLLQYFNTECPISLTEKSYIWYLSSDSVAMQLYFKNDSEKKIIAYEAVLILYNIYGEPLIYNGHISPYNQISETPVRFEPEGTNNLEYSFSSKAYYAEVYIYYALFDDQTSWGYRTNISTDTILELGTKYKIERNFT